MSKGEQGELSREEQSMLREYRKERESEVKAEAERQKRLAGYLFWCSEGCGFVDDRHRCEQWSSLTYVSPALAEALRRTGGDTELLERALADIGKAFDIVHKLCVGEARWVMSVPADERHDPDLIITNALVSARAALKARLGKE